MTILLTETSLLIYVCTVWKIFRSEQDPWRGIRSRDVFSRFHQSPTDYSSADWIYISCLNIFYILYIFYSNMKCCVLGDLKVRIERKTLHLLYQSQRYLFSFSLYCFHFTSKIAVCHFGHFQGTRLNCGAEENEEPQRTSLIDNRGQFTRG